jgi:hypothetical protein
MWHQLWSCLNWCWIEHLAAYSSYHITRTSLVIEAQTEKKYIRTLNQNCRKLWTSCTINYSELFLNVTGRTVRFSIPGKGKSLFSSPKRRDRLWGPPSLLSNGYRCSFRGVKQPGREFNHLPPFSAEVKNEGRYSSTLSICLHGLNGENISFLTFVTLLLPKKSIQICLSEDCSRLETSATPL